MSIREVAWIVGGAAVTAAVYIVIPDWSSSVAYGVGIFVGARVTRSEIRRLVEKVRS